MTETADHHSSGTPGLTDCVSVSQTVRLLYNSSCSNVSVSCHVFVVVLVLFLFFSQKSSDFVTVCMSQITGLVSAFSLGNSLKDLYKMVSYNVTRQMET